MGLYAIRGDKWNQKFGGFLRETLLFAVNAKRYTLFQALPRTCLARILKTLLQTLLQTLLLTQLEITASNKLLS